MPKSKTPVPAVQLAVPVQLIERRIYLIRGQKVMLDSDPAQLYQVETFNLNKAVKRNLDRFPEDFMFQLTAEETECLRFQIGMSKPHWPSQAPLPCHMHSPSRVRMSEVLALHKELAREIRKLQATQRDQRPARIGFQPTGEQ